MIMGTTWWKFLLFFSVVFSLQSYGQQKKTTLFLEDIYANRAYSQKSFGPVRWMKDNQGYSTLEPNKEFGGNDIVRYDAQSGQRTVLVSAKQLIPSGQAKPLNINNYNWSDDDSKLLIFTNTKKVWRYHTRGDYWVLNLKTGSLHQLGKPMESSTLMFAKFSPDGSRVGYVSKLNIYVEDLATKQIRQITHDGGDNIVNGTFDWVYEEELDCRDGFRWTPDGKNIAYWQSDTKGIGTFYLINNIDSIYSQPVPLPYPKVGTPLSAVKIGVVSADGGTTRWFNIPGKPDDHYLARMDFIPSSNEVMIQQLNRLQTQTKYGSGISEVCMLKIS
jgi:dipeptidyl-peptidase 4